MALNVTASNVPDVYSELMNSTPSYDILALACGNDFFTTNMIEDILTTNNYGIKSYLVRDALVQREAQLSEQQMANIWQAAEEISTYKDLLLQLDCINMAYTDLMQQSIDALVERDSVPIDSVKQYLEAWDDLYSNFKLINIAFGENNISHAEELFEELANKTTDQHELDDYIEESSKF